MLSNDTICAIKSYLIKLNECKYIYIIPNKKVAKLLLYWLTFSGHYLVQCIRSNSLVLHFLLRQYIVWYVQGCNQRWACRALGITNPTIFNIICWVAGSLGRMTHRPSVWCSKYFILFHNFLQNFLQKLFHFIFLFFYNFTKK